MKFRVAKRGFFAPAKTFACFLNVEHCRHAGVGFSVFSWSTLPLYRFPIKFSRFFRPIAQSGVQKEEKTATKNHNHVEPGGGTSENCNCSGRPRPKNTTTGGFEGRNEKRQTQVVWWGRRQIFFKMYAPAHFKLFFFGRNRARVVGQLITSPRPC